MHKPTHEIVIFDVEDLLALAGQLASDSENPDEERDDLRTMLTAAWIASAIGQREAFIARVKDSEVVENACAEWEAPKSLEGEAAIDWLKKVAETHGEDSEPDHEVGDLQDMFRLLWPHLTIEEQRAAFRNDDFNALLDSGGFGSFPSSAEEIDGEEWQEALENFGLDPSFQYGDEQILDIVRAYRIDVAIPELDAAEEPAHTIPLAKRQLR